MWCKPYPVMAVRDSGSARERTTTTVPVTTPRRSALLLRASLCSRLMLFT
jgi:hypothetical protein